MKHKAIIRVLASIVLAVLVGSFIDAESEILGIKVLPVFGLVGQLFLNALKLIVVPLVSSSIIIATAKMGADNAFKALGVKSFCYFLLTTSLAMLVGYGLTVAFSPGFGIENGGMGLQEGMAQTLNATSETGAFEKIADLMLRLVPSNIISSAAEGQILGLIVFCSAFGFFLSKIEKKYATALLDVFHGISQVMMKTTQLIVSLLPIGVFALVAKVVATTGIEAITSVAAFFGVVVLGLLISCLVIFSLLLKVIANVSPIAHFRAMVPAIITAFSTSSSAATMPVTIECLENKAKVPPRICDFFVPLATAINMPGTALHVCASVFFICQAYGVSFGIATQAVILLMTIITSFGVAGVPSGSLFAVVTVLTMVGLPADGIVLTLAVERLLDMSRTAANVYANSCCAVFLAKGEKQEERSATAVASAHT